MIERATVQAQRDALAARQAQAQAQYEELERVLALLDRQLCAMAGGLQELDALLDQPQRGGDDQAGEQDDRQGRFEEQGADQNGEWRGIVQ